MDLRPYVDNLTRQLVVAADAGRDDARVLIDRLVAPLDAAIRLTLQDVLTAAAEEITLELAPGSVELRLRGRDPEFVVSPPPVDPSADELPGGDHPRESSPWPLTAATTATAGSAESDEGGMARINLRMPEQLKARIERAAGADGVSVNSWLVRAATAALERTELGPRRPPHAPQGAQRYTGWVR